MRKSSKNCVKEIDNENSQKSKKDMILKTISVVLTYAKVEETIIF